MSEVLRCYRCGTDLSALTLPLQRVDECPSCTVYLHCCVMCVFYDPHVVEQCREDDAEEVKEKDHANFCEWFKPSNDAYDGKLAAAEGQANADLAALFGDDESQDNEDKPSDPDLSSAEDLFK